MLSTYREANHILGKHEGLDHGLDPLLLQLPWRLMHRETFLILDLESSVSASILPELLPTSTSLPGIDLRQYKESTLGRPRKSRASLTILIPRNMTKAGRC